MSENTRRKTKGAFKIPGLRFFLAFASFILTILLYVDRACISVAKEQISRDLNFDLTDFGWVMAVFTLGYALFQTPSGRIADKHGPRGVIAAIVAIWSVLTAVTGAAWNYVSMLVIRFLFGAGEAGAFPSLAKMVYRWFPVKERGIIQGVNFSGSRLGGAFGLILVAALIEAVGWRYSFVIFGGAGIVYALIWFLILRNNPEDHPNITDKEKEYIMANRQQDGAIKKGKLPLGKMLGSGQMWMTMVQYICSNFTFYFTLTWMYPYIKDTYGLGGVETGLLGSIPLIAGAIGNWVSGFMVDLIYKKGSLKASRQITAIIGFALAVFGMLMVSGQETAAGSVLFLSIAVFGADMTLSPSWAFCIDIGKENSATVSGTMNMAGNLGAFVTIIAFPYLLEWTGSHEPFFYIASGLAGLAIIMWLFMNPNKSFADNN